MKKSTCVLISTAVLTLFLGRNLLWVRDEFGMTFALRLALGLFNSLSIALIVLLLEICLGTFVGFFSSIKESKLLMLLITTLSSIPSFMFILPLISIHNSIFSLILGLTIHRWIGMALIVNSEVDRVKSLDYIKSARLLGRNNMWIFFKHVLPNIKSKILIKAAFSFPRIIFFEAALSSRGIGLKYPNVSLGTLLFSGFPALFKTPELFLMPAVIMFAIAFISNDIARSRVD